MIKENKDKDIKAVIKEGIEKSAKASIRNILSLNPNSAFDRKKILESGHLYLRTLELSLKFSREAWHKTGSKNLLKAKKENLLTIRHKFKEYRKMKKYDYKFWIKWAKSNKKYI